jgi:hypothetical protein
MGYAKQLGISGPGIENIRELFETGRFLMIMATVIMSVTEKILAWFAEIVKVGFGWLSQWLGRRRVATQRLNGIKAAVRQAEYVRLYSTLLQSLKQLSYVYPDLWDRSAANCNFRDDWFGIPALTAGQQGESVWDSERREKFEDAVKTLTI